MLDNKLDKLQEDVTDIKITLAQLAVHTATNTEQLGEHMKRTRAAEKRLDILEGVWYTLCATGTVLATLYGLGILQKLLS